MASGFRLKFLQNLVRAGYVLGGFIWILIGLWVGRCGHRFAPLQTLILTRVERTLLSAAFDFAVAEMRPKIKFNLKVNGGGTRVSAPHDNQRRVFFARCGLSSNTAN